MAPSSLSARERVRRRLPERIRRAPGGFTLLEVAVVAVLSAALFVIVIHWVLGFSNATTSESELNQVQANAAFVTQALRADLTRATVCAPNEAPFVEVSATKIAFYADVTGPSGGGPDGKVDLVVWRFAGGVVQRAVVVGTGSCSALVSGLSNLSYETIADGLAPSSTKVFSVFTSGSDTAASTPSSCTGTAASSCLFDRVQVRAELDAPNGAPALVSVSVPISLGGSNLVPGG